MPIPNPEPGLVISYAYLWHYEHQTGRDEGRKDRLAVIVLTTERHDDGETVVIVIPITHSAPAAASEAVELPTAIKRHLGLDDTPSWIVIAEGNEFVWPGYDLRKRPASDSYDYGFLPPRFFNQVLAAFLTWAGKSQITGRE